MIRVAYCLLAGLAIHTECFAEITKLPPADRKALESASASLREIHATTDLPPAVVALCADENGRIAEPGQKWEPTDVITDSSLPRKRLIWAVTNDEYIIVHYERGGYAHSYHVLIARLKHGDTKPILIWRATGSHLKNLKAFLAALKNKDDLDDRSDYH